jgi:histidyl-tRNA synthetase
MSNIITPKPMSGFPELMPEQQLVFNRCLDIIRRNFELSGFAPIETPSVERVDVLTSKGGDEKEIYAIRRLIASSDDKADAEFALHFDLTVPLARYVAQYKDKLAFPFRRYQIQKVWRGERAQKGRYREFYQCDIDAIGRGSIGLLNDAEMPAVIYRIFSEMGIGAFQIRINNRRLLQGFYEFLGVDAARIGDVLRIVDKLEKIGPEKVSAELADKLALDVPVREQILMLATMDAPVDSLLAELRALPMMSNALFARGVDELTQVCAGVRALGVPDAAFKLDLRIARGQGYYTGTVYETQLLSHPQLGSICSGGRYDDLASYFTNEKLPGVGISIGLSRLMFVLIEDGVLPTGAATPARVLVTTMDPSRMANYLAIAANLRSASIATEVYVEDKGRLGDQLKYASRKGIAFAVIAGESEFEAGQVKVKNLANGEERTCAADDVPRVIGGEGAGGLQQR